MSFSMTTEAVRNHTKTVTRRLGWNFLRPGDVLWAVEKGMGLKKGEKVERICLIRVVSTRLENLTDIALWDTLETTREGFPGMSAEGFITKFSVANDCPRNVRLHRIEFEYIEEDE